MSRKDDTDTFLGAIREWLGLIGALVAFFLIMAVLFVITEGPVAAAEKLGQTIQGVRQGLGL